MRCRRLGSWSCVLLALSASVSAHGQSVELMERTKTGDCFRVEMAMQLTGEMKIKREERVIPLQMAATARHVFCERAITVAAGGGLQKTARLYETAQASIHVGNDRSERKLRDDRRLLVAQQFKGNGMVYCPAGPLTRAEMELTSEHLDTLALPGLLPTKAVTIGDTWTVSNDVAQFLCCFEGLSTQDLTCKLEEVKGNLARVSVKGSATGIELGAFVKMNIEAAYHFDTSTQCLVALEWKQMDDRDQGPASPATLVVATTTIKRSPMVTPDALSDTALVSVPDSFDPPPFMTQLLHQHDRNPKFILHYSRDWNLTGQTRDHTVFRLMERGDFIAQATITPWDSARPGEHISPGAFREAMAKTPGWQQAQIVQEGEIPGENGCWTYRIVAAGEMDGLQVLQNFFVTAGPTGDQVVVVFTMIPSHAERLATRDIDFVRGIIMPQKN